MKLRAPPRYGAVSMYRLIASVFAGDAPQPGDARVIAGAGAGPALLVLGAQARARQQEPESNEREDSPANAQQLPNG